MDSRHPGLYPGTPPLSGAAAVAVGLAALGAVGLGAVGLGGRMLVMPP